MKKTRNKEDKGNSQDQAFLHKLTTYAKQAQYLTYYFQGKLPEISREFNQTVLAKRTQDTSDTANLGLVTHSPGRSSETIPLLRHPNLNICKTPAGSSPRPALPSPLLDKNTELSVHFSFHQCLWESLGLVWLPKLIQLSFWSPTSGGRISLCSPR